MIKDKIKSIANSDGKKVDNKKKIENLVVFVVILIITMEKIVSFLLNLKKERQLQVNSLSRAFGVT